MIDPEKVEDVFKDCLFREEECDRPFGTTQEPLPVGTVIGQGAIMKVGFHGHRLEAHRKQVEEWLAQLPKEFHARTGGGWSFLNACYDSKGVQWTSLHRRIDQLFLLGNALGYVKYNLPVEMWSALPGGVPYAVINLEKST